MAELLDRTKEGIAEQKDFSNDYLSSFKVASYVIKEEEAQEEEEEEVMYFQILYFSLPL